MGVADGAASGAGAGLVAGPVGALAGAGIGALGSIFSGKEQSKAIQGAAATQATAATEGAKIQADSAAKALAAEQEQQTYARGQYANYLQRMQPYQAGGAQAIGTLQNTLASIPSVRN